MANTSQWAHDVKMTSYQRHFDVVCLLGSVFFAEKIFIAFAKATHIIAAKNINVFENTLATIVNKVIIKELVKLTML